MKINNLMKVITPNNWGNIHTVKIPINYNTNIWIASS